MWLRNPRDASTGGFPRFFLCFRLIPPHPEQGCEGDGSDCMGPRWRVRSPVKYFFDECVLRFRILLHGRGVDSSDSNHFHSTFKTQQGSNFQRKHTRCASSKILHITAGSQHFRCKFTALSQHFHCRCTGLSLQVHSTFAAGSLDFHCRFTAGSQHFHCRFTAWYMVKSFLKSQAPPTHKKNPGMVHGKIFPEKPRP